MSAVVVTELATHSSPAWSASPGRDAAARSSHAGGRDHPTPVDVVLVEPVGELLLEVGEGDAGGRRGGIDRAPQLVECDELLRRDPLAGEPLERGEDVVARLLERPDRADRGRGRVVDLVREPGGQGAQRDERLALAGVALDAPGGRDEAAQEVDGEREPLLAEARQVARRQSEDPAGLHHARRPHVDAVLVPRAESAGPLSGVLDGHHHDLLVADTAHDVDPALEHHPPVLGGATLVEDTVAGGVRHLVTGGGQLGHLLVGEAVQDRDRAQLVVQHQVVAR
jgi:hypothetical protein